MRTPSLRARTARAAALAAALWLPVTGWAFTVSGTVFGSGNPLANTAVDWLVDGTTTVVASDVTDAAGGYAVSLAAGTYDVRVTAPPASGFGVATIQNVAITDDTTYDVVLIGTGSGGLSGSVRGRGGVPLAGMTVRLLTVNYDLLQEETTDANGVYSFAVGDGSYRLEVFGDPGAPSSFYCRQDAVQVSGATLLDLNADFRQVTGTVTAPGGAAVADAFVSLSLSFYDSSLQRYCSSYDDALTGPTGTYAVLGPRGPAIASNYASFVVTPPSGSPYAPYAEAFPLPNDLTRNVGLVTGSGLSGTVRGVAGNPVPGASVVLRTQAGQTLANVTADASGVYQFPNVADATYRVDVSNPSPAGPNAPSAFYCQYTGVQKTGATVFDVALPVSTVSGIVSGPGGPIANATILHSSPFIGFTNGYCYSNGEVTTGAGGGYSMAVVRGTAVDFRATPPPGVASILTRTNQNIAGDTTLNFTLPAVQALSGRIAAGAAGAEAVVYVYTPDNFFVAQALTNANGDWSANLADGTYRVESYGLDDGVAPDSWGCYRNNVVVSGATTSNLPLDVVTVDGRVTDRNGVPVQGTVVTVESNRSDPDLTCFAQNAQASDAAGLYAIRTLAGPAEIRYAPPSGSGFAPAVLSNLTLTGDVTQAVALQIPDTTPPQIVAGPTVIYLSDTSVSIVWTTDEAADSRLQYGIGSLTTTVVDPTLGTAHAVTLTGLVPNVAYVFQAASSDAAGNGPTQAAPGGFSTQPPPGDVTPPVITAGPGVAAVNTTTATIYWATDEPTSAIVHWGTAPGSLSQTASLPPTSFLLEHFVQLSGLSAGTTYYYQVESSDPDGNGPTLSGTASFTTATVPDTAPPVITAGPTITALSVDGFTVSWTTNEPASSGVSYNDGVAFGTVNDPTLVLNHTITITGLTAGSTYHVTVSSTDGAGNGPTLGGPVDVVPDDLCGNGTVDVAAGEECDEAGNPCCTATCRFAGAATVCRPSTGDCDPAEQCSGVDAVCPSDVLAPDTQVCRPAAGVCDVDDHCDGVTPTCPADVVVPDADGDGRCTTIDNCPDAANPDQTDDDGDGIGTACDPCTNLLPVVLAKPDLRLTRTLPPPGDDRIELSTYLTVPATPAIDPAANGVRIVLRDAQGDVVFDAVVPGGSQWTTRSASSERVDRYSDRYSTGPIEKVLVKQYLRTPGRTKVKVYGRHNTFDLPTMQLPLTATVVLDSPTAETGQCGESSFAGRPGCRYLGPNGARCRAR